MQATRIAGAVMAAGVLITGIPAITAVTTGGAPALADLAQASKEPHVRAVSARVRAAVPSLAQGARALAGRQPLRLPRRYVTRPGDTLSAVAGRVLGSRGAWPELWWVNRRRVPDPAVLAAGTVLRIPSRHAVPAWLAARAQAALPKPPPAPVSTPPGAGGSSSGGSTPPPAPPTPPPAAGIYSYGALESLWESAGGPSWAAASAATIAECESGGNPQAYNPSGASGLWQILGSVVPGNLFDPFVNAENAVAKFKASGDTFAQWVCQASYYTRPAKHFATATLAAAGARQMTSSVLPRRLRAWDWAHAQRGCRYDYGGEGCYPGFDCSGLIQRSYAAAGIQLPRTTYEMLGSWHLVRIAPSQARRGDLAFFGSGHVEMVAYRDRWTFGARNWGIPVREFRNVYWRPTEYFRVR